MKEISAFFLGLLVFCVFVIVASTGGLYFDRYAKPFQEETRRQTYERSIGREEGVENQINAYCLNMRTAKDPADKKAFAGFVVSQADTYQGALLTPGAASCVQEAKSLIAP